MSVKPEPDQKSPRGPLKRTRSSSLPIPPSPAVRTRSVGFVELSDDDGGVDGFDPLDLSDSDGLASAAVRKRLARCQPT
jgi:hypothetical protein